jgi:hypothetical protein
MSNEEGSRDSEIGLHERITFSLCLCASVVNSHLTMLNPLPYNPLQ